MNLRKSRIWLFVAIVAGILIIAGFFLFHRGTPAPNGGNAGPGGAPTAGGPPGGGGGPPGGGGGGRRAGGFGGAASGPPTVGTATAKISDIGVYLSELGTVTPLKTAIVQPLVNGLLTKIFFEEGQTVKAGAPLAEIDPRPFAAALLQAQGQLLLAQAQLKNAQLDLERYRTLYAQDSIAKQTLDTQEALVQQYEGTVKTDQGAVDAANLNLTYAHVTAPIGGRLGLRQVDVGNSVTTTQTNGIVIITQLQPITVEFSIPQDQLPQVLPNWQKGKALLVEAYDRSQKNKLATGKLLSVDNQIDTTTGTVKLKAQFANDDNALFPNQFVNIRLQTAIDRNVTIVPTIAIQQGSQGAFVYVVKADNTVEQRPVKAGIADGDNTAITSGISAGEIVVVDGIDRLRDGARVLTASSGGAKGNNNSGGGNGNNGNNGSNNGNGQEERPKHRHNAENAGGGNAENAGNDNGNTAPADGAAQGQARRHPPGGGGNGAGNSSSDSANSPGGSGNSNNSQ